MYWLERKISFLNIFNMRPTSIQTRVLLTQSPPYPIYSFLLLHFIAKCFQSIHGEECKDPDQKNWTELSLTVLKISGFTCSRISEKTHSEIFESKVLHLISELTDPEKPYLAQPPVSCCPSSTYQTSPALKWLDLFLLALVLIWQEMSAWVTLTLSVLRMYARRLGLTDRPNLIKFLRILWGKGVV